MARAASAEAQLDGFIACFTPEVAALAHAVLAKMRRLYPHALELVYDNYNALAVGFGPTEKVSEVIFSIAVYPRWVSLFFLQGAGLADPDSLLQGKGNVARHIRLASAADLDDAKVHRLMDRAAAEASRPFSPETEHRLVIKSISAKQRPRRPAGSKV
jgi:hypothetical protein